MSKAAVSLGTVLLAAIATAAIARAKDNAPTARLTPAAAVAGHCAAWNTTNRADRDRLLRRVFASDGVYSDPTPTYAAGRAALSNEIANFQREYPGSRFRCSAPQIHHSAMRVSWLLLRPDRKVRAQGMDFYELAQDGLIRRVTGFFGPPPVVALTDDRTRCGSRPKPSFGLVRFPP
jgi:hypothetical protein